jgi:glucose-6-phosphate isomerase
MKNINLSHFVPFELYINPETNLIEQADALELKYNTRKLFDMKEVIYDKKWLEKQENNFDLYYMYRNLIREQDKELFEQHNIRFDITIIPPKKLGKELVKTAGHFHPKIEGEMSYPEVYEVMHGEGLYLLQKEELTRTGEIELIIIAAHAGDQILIPCLRNKDKQILDVS